MAAGSTVDGDTDMGTWFEVRELPDGVVGIGEPGHSEDVKSYLVRGRDLALLVDTGMGVSDIRAVVDELIETPVLLVNSHSHWDHIGGNPSFERIWIHAAEAERLPRGVPNSRLRRAFVPEHLRRPLPAGFDPETFEIGPSRAERTLSGVESIDLGDRSFSVIHTPGHSPGGITLFEERTGIAIVGDAVYAGAMYGHMAGESDPVAYRATLRRLAELAPSASAVYPSHNAYPLESGFLTSTHEAMEEIWGGRAPNGMRDGVERYSFGRFSFLLREGWRGE